MRIVYQENERVAIAEADEISRKGSTLSVLLRDGRTLNFPFQSEDVLTECFDEVIVPAGDKPIRLQFTAFDPRMSQMFNEWDALFED